MIYSTVFKLHTVLTRQKKDNNPQKQLNKQKIFVYKENNSNLYFIN